MLLKRKGFTLIELLAVIVILAIIALIASPIIIGVIEGSKKESVSRSADGIVRSANNYYMNKKLLDESVDKSINLTEDSLIYDGKKPEKGYAIFDDKGNTSLLMYLDGYCVIKLYQEEPLIDKKTAEECDLEAYLPVYKDLILNGADPILDEGMIPIYFDGNTAKKADIYDKWYDYSNKIWANAILVSQSTREEYKNMEKGEEINLDDVLAYFVWIPRYKYELFNVEGVANVNGNRSIEIVFENKDTEKSTGNTNGSYLTAPGFTFGDDELNGFWVGKFELSGYTASSARILPNVVQRNRAEVKSYFVQALDIGNRILNANGTITDNGNNPKNGVYLRTVYGLVSESRMITNDEWGATAYLSHSKYGIDEEIRVNNAYLMTGCGAATVNEAYTTECQIKYGEVVDYKYPQSTTGNITGVFDMSGGLGEYVMGYMSTANAAYVAGDTSYFGWRSDSNSARFTAKINDKYWNNFVTPSSMTACSGNACLGGAILETNRWYTDNNTFVGGGQVPWMIRGGSYAGKANSGIFSYERGSGGGMDNLGTRVVVINSVQ